jgi:hypothetical protein
MSEVVTLEIPDELAHQARALATATNRRLEDAVVEWIGRAVAEPGVESLPNDQLLALCDAALDAAQQDELSTLLSRHRESELEPQDRSRLDELMLDYRRGLVLKARAIHEAVRRRLKPPLANDAA